MGFLTDLWTQICEFFEIEAVEPITSKEPPKPLEPVESVTTLPKKTEPIAPIEEIEPLPVEPVSEPTSIGEQGRADRIKVLPAKPEPETPFTEPPSAEDYPATIQFFVKSEGMPLAGANVTFLGQTATTDGGQCSISGRMKILKNYPITASKSGYRTATDEISFAFAPRSGTLGGTKILYMEKITVGDMERLS